MHLRRLFLSMTYAGATNDGFQHAQRSLRSMRSFRGIKRSPPCFLSSCPRAFSSRLLVAE